MAATGVSGSDQGMSNSLQVMHDHLPQKVRGQVFPMPRWVQVSMYAPVPDRPILIWRSSFTENDYPVYGRYCSCHHRYIYSHDGWRTTQYADDATYWKDAYSGPNIGG